MNYQNKEMLMGAMIVAGYDEAKGGQVGRRAGQRRQRGRGGGCEWAFE